VQNYQTELRKREGVIKLKESNVIELERELRRERERLEEQYRLERLELQFQREEIKGLQQNTIEVDMTLEDCRALIWRYETKIESVLNLEKTLQLERS
jgi:hypothetical protein